MAEITTNTRVARVDMTPMVDLGFLLITFFMFTTTLSTPNMMKLNMPDSLKETSVPPIRETSTLSLILGKDNRVFWHQKNFNDLNTDLLQEVNYGMSLRKLILEKRKEANNQDTFTVLIRGTDDANYKNAVDALDEMVITKQDKYLLADLTPKEKLVYEAKLKP